MQVSDSASPGEALLVDLQQFGHHCMAYSVLQPGMFFFHEPGRGFVPYMLRSGRAFVLAGAICDPAYRVTLLRQFLKVHPRAVFAQSYEEDVAPLREQFGYKTTQMGVETWVDLPNWNLSGPGRALLRRHRNMAQRIGIIVRELGEQELPAVSKQVADLKKAWLSRRTTTNALRFLVRPEQEHEPGVRRFVGQMADGTIVSYVVCDPVYDAGKPYGYSLNLTYYAHRIPVPGEATRVFHGINYVTSLGIFDQLKKEGLRAATFGMSPLHALEPAPNEHRWLRQMLGFTREHAGFLYSFKGTAQFKQAFQSQERKVFFASRSMGLPTLIATLRLSNLIQLSAPARASEDDGPNAAVGAAQPDLGR